MRRVLAMLGLAALVGCAPGRTRLPDPLEPLVPTPVEAFRAQPPAVPPIEAMRAERVEVAKLPSGMSVLVASRPSRLATLCYVSRAAGVDDAPSVAGYVRLTTELMMGGTEAEKLGASTGHQPDQTRICVTLRPERLAEAVTAFAQVVRQPRFEADAAVRARTRWLARLDDGIEARREAQRWLLGETRALGMPGDAVRLALSRFDRSRAVVTHARAFVPADSAIVVAGGVTLEQAKAAAAEAFGDWQADAQPLPSIPPMATGRPADVVLHVEPRFQASMAVAFAAPPRTSPDRAAFTVLERVLGRMFTSRLNLAIREGDGHSYGAYASYAPLSRDGILTVTTAVAHPRAVTAARLILGEILRMQQTLPTDAELAAAPATGPDEWRAQLERTPTLAGELAELFVAGWGPEAWPAFDAQVAAVTGEDVRRVAETYLSRRSPLVVVATIPVLEAFARSELDVGYGPDARRAPSGR